VKLKLKIPVNNTNWPGIYLGQEVTVEVDAVRFPDGTTWSVCGDSYNLESNEQAAQASLTKVLGTKPTRIIIET